ncbi:hypothetical protein APHAL10511_003447 [Amanita phalloides]|nr:hypothetical protein APHAL10511_003447 [Amanita phalloides]
MTTTGTFCFQGCKGLLTYSCIGDAFTTHAFAITAIDHICLLANEHYKYCWAVEQHHDEGIDPHDPFTSHHIHIVFDLGKPCTEHSQIFDYGGFHPNIKPCGGCIQWENQVKYLEKDGFFGGNINLTEEDNPVNDVADNIYCLALLQTTEEAFQSTIADGDLESFCKSYISIWACGKDWYAKEPCRFTSTRTTDDFANIPLLLRTYAAYIKSEEIIERPRSLISISPTRYSKTQWA